MNTSIWILNKVWTSMVNRCWRWNLDIGNMGNREHVLYVQCAVCIVRTVYSTCKWDRIVRTVVQYVLWCHKAISTTFYVLKKFKNRYTSWVFINISQTCELYKFLPFNKTIIYSTNFTPIPMQNNISVVISTIQNYNDN